MSVMTVLNSEKLSVFIRSEIWRGGMDTKLTYLTLAKTE